MGVLSALPIISVGNTCCCLWVVGGGFVAAYLQQQMQDVPISPADGALIGLLAGLAGAVVYLIISVPIDLVLGPLEREMMRRIVENMAGAEGFRDYADRADMISGARAGRHRLRLHAVPRRHLLDRRRPDRRDGLPQNGARSRSTHRRSEPAAARRCTRVHPRVPGPHTYCQSCVAPKN